MQLYFPSSRNGGVLVRIGKFGETNQLSIDTIRHYMDLGLIVPEKKGGQYFFDLRCQKDLENILELKGLGFSLNEIKIIFYYKNFGIFTDYEEDTYYQSLFLDKYEKLEQEIKGLKEAKERLKQKLDYLATKSEGASCKMGVDLGVLSLLRCLKCGEQLTLQDGSIHRNQILEGKLACDCGEEYLIDSGILMVGEPVQLRSGFISANHILEYIHGTDPDYLENLHKGLHWSKRKMDQVDLHHKVLLELGTGVGFFLRNFYQELPDDCLYIAVDRNLERHQFLKRVLEKAGSKKRILFICSDFLEIPIQNHSIDLVIDHSGTSNYSFEHEEFLLQEVDPLVKEDGYLLGAYFGFKNFSPKGKIEPKYRDNFTISQIKRKLSELKYKCLEERTSEYINQGGKFENFFVQGEEICFYSFFGKR
jgi:DNA-binding transcriptional MerR regulator/ubiquinone/menaquinone biosynthesis C-methylase UbiE